MADDTSASASGQASTAAVKMPQIPEGQATDTRRDQAVQAVQRALNGVADVATNAGNDGVVVTLRTVLTPVAAGTERRILSWVLPKAI